MPLLLLLSAILTALTGAVAGVRPVDVQIARQAASTDSRNVVASVSPALSGHAHLLGAFGISVSFAAAPGVPIPTAAAPRLYLDRPRA